MNPFTLLFSFRGRVNRAKFWLTVLIWIVFFMLVVGGTAFVTESMSAVFGMALLSYIPIIISTIAVGVKRLHDRNKTAWWLLVFYGVPLAMPFVVILFGGAEPDSGTLGGIILQFVSLAIMIWTIVELGAIRGTIGVNPYGPDPLAPEPAPQPRAH